jgi:RNA polymerase sigma-70 factor (ECF subfamily)
MTTSEAIQAVFRQEAGRVLATLIRLLGDFDLAEEGLQEAFAAAVAQWPTRGLPDNPRAWLVRAGRNKSIDRIRGAILRRERQPELEAVLQSVMSAADDDADGAVEDDMLRLIFTCCHPALSLEAQVALTLRAVCGLSTTAVARAFLLTEEAMAQRLVRAKRKIRAAKIPYATPAADQFDARIEGVLATVYLVFTEGYAHATLAQGELAGEAIRLGRLLDALLPRRAAVKGLLALMLLHDGRRPARAMDSGEIVLLDDQDRACWDKAELVEGLRLVEEALRLPFQLSPYAVEAAIAALHAQAARPEETDWPQILGLYEVLLRLKPSPVVELNHAAAVAMVDGPARALDLMDALAARGALAGYHLLAGARGELLRRLGRREEAEAATRAALALAQLEPERRLYARRLAALADQGRAVTPALAMGCP